MFYLRFVQCVMPTMFFSPNECKMEIGESHMNFSLKRLFSKSYNGCLFAGTEKGRILPVFYTKKNKLISYQEKEIRCAE